MFTENGSALASASESLLADSKAMGYENLWTNIYHDKRVLSLYLYALLAWSQFCISSAAVNGKRLSTFTCFDLKIRIYQFVVPTKMYV